jgi:YHS domain-containing protein
MLRSPFHDRELGRSHRADPTMPTPLLLGAAVLSLLAAAPLPQEESPPRETLPHYNLEDGLALSGYDPVAYFPEGGGKAVKGSAEHTATHRGVTYRFTSEQNRERFLAEPARFEPAYGGWCAWAMARGKQVEVDPEAYVLEEGRLLLFYNRAKRDEWVEARGGMRKDADAHWERIASGG